MDDRNAAAKSLRIGLICYPQFHRNFRIHFNLSFFHSLLKLYRNVCSCNFLCFQSYGLPFHYCLILVFFSSNLWSVTVHAFLCVTEIVSCQDRIDDQEEAIYNVQNRNVCRNILLSGQLDQVLQVLLGKLTCQVILYST